MRFISLFAGIGGMDLGLERAGMTCVAQVEKDPFCLQVLGKHWPHVPKFDDIHTFTREVFDEPVDLIAGGFPCQPFSQAGKRLGAEDDRNLWPQMFRIVQEFKPAWVVGENVAALINTYLDTVCADLESEGYEVQPLVLPVGAFGLPQRRNRVFILAYADRFRQQTYEVQRGAANQAQGKDVEGGLWRQEYRFRDGRTRPAPHADVFRVADGFPSELDKARLKALGNSVAPVVVEFIGREIMEVEKQSCTDA